MDRDTFEEFIRAHLPALGRHAIRLTGNRDEASDLAQETAYRLARAWDRVERDGNALAYARTIMTRLYLTRRRREQFLGRVLPMVASSPLAQDQIAAADDNLTIRQALNRLTPIQRAVIVLGYLEDLDDNTIAEMTQRRPATVRSIRKRAIAALRDGVAEKELLR
jgi:RNA polymerase sigma factor (sigma-70 family)